MHESATCGLLRAGDGRDGSELRLKNHVREVWTQQAAVARLDDRWHVPCYKDHHVLSIVLLLFSDLTGRAAT